MNNDFPSPYKASLIVSPVPPRPAKPTGLAAWFGGLRYAKLERTWQAEKDRLEDRDKVLNWRQRIVFDLENTTHRLDQVKTRLWHLERTVPELLQERASALCVLEQEVLDEFAEYQLKRDYFGDMNPEALRAEYRAIACQKPSAGLLRESDNQAVRAIIGTGAGFPALPPPPNRNEAEAAWLRVLRDELQKQLDENPEFLMRYREVVRHRWQHKHTGKPFVAVSQEWYFKCVIRGPFIHWYGQIARTDGYEQQPEEWVENKLRIYRIGRDGWR